MREDFWCHHCGTLVQSDNPTHRFKPELVTLCLEFDKFLNSHVGTQDVFRREWAKVRKEIT
jgi:hypothetical protein